MIPVDDSGGGTDGTILLAADWIALAPGTAAPTTTGTQTALAIPAGTGDLVLYLNNATLLTIQGIAAGLSGQRLTLVSKGAGQVDCAHLHASGTALGKLKLFATTGLTSLAAGSGVAVLQYDATVTQWRLINHEQGAWITPTFAAGDYTGNASMTWTLAAGDRLEGRYKLNGTTLSYQWVIVTSTVGGTPNTTLQIGNAAWGGFTVSANTQITGVHSYNDNGGTEAIGRAFVLSGGTVIGIQKLGLGNWTAATDTTTTQGKADFSVS